MADAIFLNATPFEMSLNLNSSQTNKQLTAMPAVRKSVPPTLTLPGAAYSIAANKQPNVFGASPPDDTVENILIIFSQGSSQPQFWYIASMVSITLDLMFYIFANNVLGVDQTGSRANITTRQATPKELQRLQVEFATLVRTFSEV